MISDISLFSVAVGASPARCIEGQQRPRCCKNVYRVKLVRTLSVYGRSSVMAAGRKRTTRGQSVLPRDLATESRPSDA